MSSLMHRTFSVPLAGLLLGCSANGAPLIGMPYSNQNTLNSSFCQTARCGRPDIGKYGDKFGAFSDLYTVYTYPLALPASGLIYGELMARVRPDGKLDVLKLNFLVPKAARMKAVVPTVTQWLKLVRLPTTAAATCIKTLDQARNADLTNLPKGVEGSCSASDGRPGYRIVNFGVYLPIQF